MGINSRNVDLRVLRYFVAVAEHESFVRAAEAIPMDHGALSRDIKALETEIGAVLFIRSRQGTRITPAGQRMLHECQTLFAQLDNVLRVVREIDGCCRAPLRVGIADGMVQPRLSRCLSEWRELIPRTELELQEMRTTQVLEKLRREEIDIAFCFGMSEGSRLDGMVQEPVWTDPVVVLVPPNHALAQHASLSLAQVVAQPLILCDPQLKPGFHAQTDALVREHTEHPNIVGLASSLANLITQVGSGYGIGLADDGHMQTLARPDVVSIPLDDPSAVLATYVVYKRAVSEQPGGSLSHFLSHVTSLC